MSESTAREVTIHTILQNHLNQFTGELARAAKHHRTATRVIGLSKESGGVVTSETADIYRVQDAVMVYFDDTRMAHSGGVNRLTNVLRPILNETDWKITYHNEDGLTSGVVDWIEARAENDQ